MRLELAVSLKRDMMSTPSASVIIPTFNRSGQLFNCLSSLEKQTYPQSKFEIIVVDDGSIDGTREIVLGYFSRCRYLHQNNQGQVSALNNGAVNSHGDVLIFMDDDVIVELDFIARIMHSHDGRRRTIVLPVVESASCNPTSTFTKVYLSSIRDESASRQRACRRVGFTDLVGCCFAVHRRDFFDVGIMQSPAIGLWPDWNDLEFAYRAKLLDIEFVQYADVVVKHYEFGFRNLDAACTRSYNCGLSATYLFEMHPAMVAHMPMFRDKVPINWHKDSPWLIGRKIARHVFSSLPSLRTMIRLACMFESCCPNRHILLPLYRWIIGGYIYRGYREGLRKCARARSQNGGC